jgi:hypothetical protein
MTRPITHVLTKDVRTYLPMFAFILDHSPRGGRRAWVPLGPSFSFLDQGGCTRRSEGVTSNTPTGLYRLALHPSAVLLWLQHQKPAGCSLTVMHPSGLPPETGSGFPRPRCYRVVRSESSPQRVVLGFDNGVTHLFGKKLLVSTACTGVRSLLSAWKIRQEWRCHMVPPFFFLGHGEAPSRAGSLCLALGVVKDYPLPTTVFTHPELSTGFYTL